MVELSVAVNLSRFANNSPPFKFTNSFTNQFTFPVQAETINSNNSGMVYCLGWHSARVHLRNPMSSPAKAEYSSMGFDSPCPNVTFLDASFSKGSVRPTCEQLARNENRGRTESVKRTTCTMLIPSELPCKKGNPRQRSLT
jgi:hypothetical protein